MNQQDEKDWLSSGIKYYQAYLIVNYFGYTKQALNLLCFSIEKLLKGNLAIKEELCADQLKSYNHHLKKLFDDSKLDKSKFSLIRSICHGERFNTIRYEFDGRVNELSNLIDKLDQEIKSLCKEIIKNFNKKHNCSLKPDYWPTPRQYTSDKQTILKKCFEEKMNNITRMDFT